MGLFSLFSKQASLDPELDGVWLSNDAKLTALKQDVERSRDRGAVMILAHFPSTLAAVQEVLGDLVEPRREASETDLLSLVADPRPGRSHLALATALPVAPAPAPGAAATPISVLVAERYPLRCRDDAIGSMLASLGTGCRLRFFISLDDPLLKKFSGEQLRHLMDALGMDDTEEINHPMVVKAVARVQKKLAKASRADLPANSPEQWMQYNLAHPGG